MSKKIRLTNLRHLETSKDEMGHVKGGDDPEKGPVTCRAACDCSTSCIIELNEQEKKFRLIRNNESGGSKLSGLIDGLLILTPFFNY